MIQKLSVQLYSSRTVIFFIHISRGNKCAYLHNVILLCVHKEYYYVGGIPEAVANFADSTDYNVVREIQQKILTAYKFEEWLLNLPLWAIESIARTTV